MEYRAYASYEFARGLYGIHLAMEDLVLQPVDFEWVKTDPTVATDPAMYLDKEAARELYDALGKALGIHLSDTRLAAKVLEREQGRVDRLLNHITRNLE